MDMFDKGATVLFVSHTIEQVMAICNRAIILDNGSLVADGPAEEICKLYEEKFIERESGAMKPRKEKDGKAKKKKKKKTVSVEVSEELGIDPEKKISKDNGKNINEIIAENMSDVLSEFITEKTSDNYENKPEGIADAISDSISDNN